jgi:hypothetical protein
MKRRKLIQYGLFALAAPLTACGQDMSGFTVNPGGHTIGRAMRVQTRSEWTRFRYPEYTERWRYMSTYAGFGSSSRPDTRPLLDVLLVGGVPSGQPFGSVGAPVRYGLGWLRFPEENFGSLGAWQAGMSPAEIARLVLPLVSPTGVELSLVPAASASVSVAPSRSAPLAEVAANVQAVRPASFLGGSGIEFDATGTGRDGRGRYLLCRAVEHQSRLFLICAVTQEEAGLQHRRIVVDELFGSAALMR